MAPSCWAFFLKFCPKLSWAGECGGVMGGIMLGGENNMLRPAPGGKFVLFYAKNRDMARWAQNLGQYGQIIEKIWLRRLIWDNLENCPNFCGHVYFVPRLAFPHYLYIHQVILRCPIFLLIFVLNSHVLYLICASPKVT